MMIEKFINQLRQEVGPSAIFSEFKRRFDFSSYIDSSDFLKDKRRLERFAEEQSLVYITGDQNSISLYDDESITVLLSRRCNKLPYIYTHVSPKFIVCLSDPAIRMLHLFDCPGSYECDPVAARQLTLHEKGTVFIDRLVPWSPPSMDTLYAIDSPADNSFWITAFSKSESHYFHAYSTEGAGYLFSAFATLEACSLYYMAEIAFYAISQAAAESSEAILTELKVASEGMSSINSMPATGLWRLAEAWSPVDPSHAVQLLIETRSRGGAIGAKARHVLEMLKI